MKCSRPAAAALLAAFLAVPSRAEAQLSAQPYVTGISRPVAFVPDPTSSDRQFVVEQTGRIRVVVNGALLATDFLDLSGVVTPPTSVEGERGLLGMVLAPDYAATGRFFVAFTRESASPQDRGDVVFARFTRSGATPTEADPGSRFDLRWGSPQGPAYIEHTSSPYHNGGCMAFGPDGYLYLALGDGVDGDPDNNAQNPFDLRGKILRIDINVSDGDPQGYRVPDDNPFLDGVPIAASPEIWSFGFRNPWRFTFDSPALGGTGAMLIADVGQTSWEEINYEPAQTGGRNYGWRIQEGTHDFVNPNVPDYVAPPAAFLPLTDPVFEYGHDVGHSVTGGYVYRGAGLGESMRGRYFFGDFVFGRLWSALLMPFGQSAQFSNILEHTDEVVPGRMSTFATDAQGELYIVTYGVANGVVSRLCGFTVTGETTFLHSGGTGSFQVTAPAGCNWSLSENSPWITSVAGAPGSGPGTVTFNVTPNASPNARQATLTVAGREITVVQQANPHILGDIDGSGGGDLMWQHTDGRIAVWRMSGTTLASGEPFGPPLVPDPDWRLAAVGDFDADGDADAVLQHAVDGRLSIWVMNGTALVGQIPLPQVPETAWKIRAAADMNGDGSLDLVWQHTIDGRISVWLMSGTQLIDGLVLTSGPLVPDTTWRIVAAADMNGDGSQDLIWQNDANGLLAAWLMNGLTYIDGVFLSPGEVADTAWKVRGVGDFNLDGHPDLIWHHQTTGTVSVWLMNGLTLIDGMVLTPSSVPDTNWKVAGPR